MSKKIKLLVEVDEKDYKDYKDGIDNLRIKTAIKNAVFDGTPITEGDLISREALINAKPEFMNEKVVRDTKYKTTKDRVYAKAWNACNSRWLDIINNSGGR